MGLPDQLLLVNILPDSSCVSSLVPAGAQGGSVARAILESKKFTVRALTRDVTQPNAQALRDLGAEVVKGDLNDEKSVEATLKGAYGAFLANASLCIKDLLLSPRGRWWQTWPSLGLKHVVYSGLEHGEVEEHFWAAGVPMTSVRVAAYFENFLTAWKPAKAPDGDYYSLVLPMGDVPMDGISVADIGAAVSSIFNSPEEFIGKAVGLSAEKLTVQQYADVLSKGQSLRDTYKKLGFPMAEEIANMCLFYQMKPDRDVKLTHRLNPKVKSFSQFISENKEAFKGL
uniref:NmrA-like family domain-containing protein 1 n=1 Tax=Prolemur simus TaxID=1328070 RepID=A0A8C9DPY9_PROSS